MSDNRISVLIAIGLAATACDRDGLTSPSTARRADEMPFEAVARPDSVTTDMARAVATVDLGTGGSVTFLGLDDGQIGVAERVPRTGQFVARRMFEQFDATPLEVYLALQPRGTMAPEALVRDHRLRAAVSRTVTEAPRVLSAVPIAMSLASPGVEFYVCDAFGWDWIDDWKAAFVGITKYREATYRHQQSGNFTFYPGAPVYEGTNTNSKTYLGACNGDAYDDLVVEIHRRISGAWVKVHEVTLDSYEKYTFYSGVPSSYRGRAHAVGGQINEHYGVGAAWTLSPGVATP